MENKLYAYYKDLPNWSKGIISVVVVGGAGLLAYSFYNSIKRKKDIRKALIISRDAKNELSELKRKGVFPSYSPSQYQSFSLKLVESMNGCGTNEDSIYSVFSAMKNKADVLSLIDAFGVRFYTPCAASQPVAYFKWYLDDQSFGGVLPSWLEYDLTSGEISKINGILESKGIDYRF